MSFGLVLTNINFLVNSAKCAYNEVLRIIGIIFKLYYFCVFYENIVILY
jgi:hypothetical protein